MTGLGVKFPAPAKLNLFLHILGKRDDGYHNLQTLFQFLDYADQLEFALRDDAKIVLHCEPYFIEHKNNLVVKAAEMLRTACPTTCATKGVSISLHKKIPLGSGLGGGSSDAATTLRVLNELWQCHLPMAQLMSIGGCLGLDVPAFLYGKAAWAEERGDKLSAVDLPKAWYIVLVPAVEISTANMFSAIGTGDYSDAITIDDYQAGLCMNLFTPTVRERYAEVNQAMTWLEQYAPTKLSGTGAGVFSEFSDQQAAQEIFAKKPESIFGFVSKSTNPSCLLSYLRNL